MGRGVTRAGSGRGAGADRVEAPRTETAKAAREEGGGAAHGGAGAGSVGGLLVVGDVITDVIARPHGPLARGTDTAATVRMLPGGAGSNVACWAAHWGCREVRLIGRVGSESAAWHRRALTGSGVVPRLVVDPLAPTGTVVSLVDAGSGGERTFLTDSGASLRLCAEDWAPSALDGISRAHLSGYLLFSESGRGLVRTVIASARARAVPVSVDPASAGFLRELGAGPALALLRGADVLLPSRDEAQLLTGLSNPRDAAAVLSRRFPLVVVKRGPEGALVARDGAVRAEVPAVAATAQDATGAGDAFTGAFLTALIAGADAVSAAGEGCRAGARAVERLGARPPDPTPIES